MKSALGLVSVLLFASAAATAPSTAFAQEPTPAELSAMLHAGQIWWDGDGPAFIVNNGSELYQIHPVKGIQLVASGNAANTQPLHGLQRLSDHEFVFGATIYNIHTGTVNQVRPGSWRHIAGTRNVIRDNVVVDLNTGWETILPVQYYYSPQATTCYQGTRSIDPVPLAHNLLWYQATTKRECFWYWNPSFGYTVTDSHERILDRATNEDTPDYGFRPIGFTQTQIIGDPGNGQLNRYDYTGEVLSSAAFPSVIKGLVQETDWFAVVGEAITIAETEEELEAIVPFHFWSGDGAEADVRYLVIVLNDDEPNTILPALLGIEDAISSSDTNGDGIVDAADLV